jgi:ribosome maturation factor RimP
LDPLDACSDADDRPRHTGLEARLADIVFDPLAAMGYDLVRVAILGREHPTVQIMADRADGAAVGIEDCEAISQAMGPVIDVADPMPGAWTLEVSSPGIDRPLTRRRDWNRYAGHQARIEMDIPVEGRKRATGVALGADRHTVRLRLDDGLELAVPFENIRRAKLVLTDALIAATAPAAARTTN